MQPLPRQGMRVTNAASRNMTPKGNVAEQIEKQRPLHTPHHAPSRDQAAKMHSACGGYSIAEAPAEESAVPPS
eukprot:scaffold878_cov271-Pinguiococcus_pyrenoidosus.AAC.60